MEKETFYEKLKKLNPTVKAYFDMKIIADTPERLYVLEKCKDGKPQFDTDVIKSEEVQSLKNTQKAITVILGAAMVLGLIYVIIGIVNLSGMDFAVGAGFCAGAFFLLRYWNGKFNEKLCTAQEQQAVADEYERQVETVKAEHRTAVETLGAKYEDMKTRFDELGLSSVVHLINSYEDFSQMLSYAKKHPNQTTANSYLKEVREQMNQRSAFLYTQSQFDQGSGYSIEDDGYIFGLSDMLEHDREEPFRHDWEMKQREEQERRDEQRRAEQQAWDEKKKQEAQDRIDHRKKNWDEINERSRLEKELRHQCNTCSLASKCYMRGSFPCPSYRPR